LKLRQALGYSSQRQLLLMAKYTSPQVSTPLGHCQ
jgi:hypothetical protein